MRQGGQGANESRAGVAMAALLVGLSVMAVMMTVALPAWSHAVRRERETELVWRGEQYQRAIRLFQRRFANTFPPSVDVLVQQKFLRKQYKDPITGDDFQVIPVGAVLRPDGWNASGAGAGTTPGAPSRSTLVGSGMGTPSNSVMGPNPIQALGIQGVVSKSSQKSIRILNGAATYDAWYFTGTTTGQQAGLPPNAAGNNQARPGLPQSLGAPSPQTPAGGASPFGAPVSSPPTGPGAGGFGTRPQVPPPPAWRPR